MTARRSSTPRPQSEAQRQVLRIAAHRQSLLARTASAGRSALSAESGSYSMFLICSWTAAPTSGRTERGAGSHPWPPEEGGPRMMISPPGTEYTVEAVTDWLFRHGRVAGYAHPGPGHMRPSTRCPGRWTISTRFFLHRGTRNLELTENNPRSSATFSVRRNPVRAHRCIECGLRRSPRMQRPSVPERHHGVTLAVMFRRADLTISTSTSHAPDACATSRLGSRAGSTRPHGRAVVARPRSEHQLESLRHDTRTNSLRRDLWIGCRCPCPDDDRRRLTAPIWRPPSGALA
jgi:hypothetical protein